MNTVSEPATVVISHRVKAGREADYAAWRASINTAVEQYDGFDGLEEILPRDGAQDDWVIVFRFTSAAQLAAWLSSDERRALLADVESLIEASHEQVVATPQEADEPQTIVISERVRPGREEDYRAWQSGITAAASRFPGYVGGERFPPVPGVQDEWVYMLRFATSEQLDGWLSSAERQRWRDKAEPLLEHVDIQRVAAGLGGWFPIRADRGEQPPPDWKQAMAVLLAMYPTVMLLMIFISPLLESAPEAADMFVRAFMNVVILTWLLMPLVNKVLKPWLYPRHRVATWAGTAGVWAIYMGLVAAFTVY